jgi:phage terminase large subunit-like protein
VPRGNGKSYAAAAVGTWRLVCGPPPQLVLSAALDYEGARVALDHAKRIVQRHADLDTAVEIRADSILVLSTDSRWLVRSREHTASRGLHPNLVLYDEIGWARDDELFASLLAAQASVIDPLLLVVSTVGRRKAGPLWQLKALAEAEMSA